MKQRTLISIIPILGLSVLLFVSNSCKKDSKTDPGPDSGIEIATAGIGMVTLTTATCGGSIATDGGSTITARGVCWGTGQTPTIADNKTIDGAGAGAFISMMSGLLSHTTYFVRAYATNSKGTAYGSTMSFTTTQLITQTVTEIGQFSATCGGTITADMSVVIVERGVCWSAAHTPTIDDSKTSNGPGSGSFTGELTGLLANTPYKVRMYATTLQGTEYGNEVTFTTSPIVTISDIDGNVYQTVKIGTQVWMAENLKVAHYRNGDPITYIQGWEVNYEWATCTYGAYCSCYDDPWYDQFYGTLYNGYAVKDPRGIAPEGWHIPTDAEWTTLQEYLGGAEVAGGKLKETGTENWKEPNLGATNESGFSARAGGGRDSNGYFGPYQFDVAYWWSSFESESGIGGYWCVDFLSTWFYKSENVTNLNSGFSIRCVKD